MIPPIPMQSRSVGKNKFCVQIWTFHAFSIKISFSEIVTNPIGLGASKPQFCTFMDIKCIFQYKKNIFSELGPNFTC